MCSYMVKTNLRIHMFYINLCVHIFFIFMCSYIFYINLCIHICFIIYINLCVYMVKTNLRIHICFILIYVFLCAHADGLLWAHRWRRQKTPNSILKISRAWPLAIRYVKKSVIVI